MMSYELVHTFPHEMLTSTQNDTCISLYQPTYRTGNEQNIIRFKNLTNEIEQSLKSRLSKQALDERMRPFQEIMNDREFWRSTQEGLAIFSSSDRCIVYFLQRPVKEFSLVANCFHIKPLIRVYQSADQYHLLGISRKEFAMFIGTSYEIENINMHPDICSKCRHAIGEDSVQKVV